MTSETTPELLSCPFCGNTDIKWGGDDKIVGCWCEDCQMTGPNHYGRFEWNTRSDLVAAKDARIAELEEYAVAATKALTGLTVGGSEFFAGQKLGFYKADIPVCVKHIEQRIENARKFGEARGRSFAKSDRAALSREGE